MTGIVKAHKGSAMVAAERLQRLCLGTAHVRHEAAAEEHAWRLAWQTMIGEAPPL